MITTHRFSDNRKAEFRALQIWHILVCAAENRQTLTYKILAGRMGYEKGAHVLSNSLGHVAHYCNLNRLPPLTALVVTQKTGLPGDGIPVEESLTKRDKVFGCDWFDIIPPTPDELKEAAMQGRKVARNRGNPLPIS